MNRLSTPHSQLKNHYPVVVVGSGYGGGIAASRLAHARQELCVLERGKEFLPGDFPNTKVELFKQVQTDLPVKHIGSPSALVDVRFNDDINVVLGCGLGGTSLFNSGVSIRPDPRVFDDPIWPEEILEHKVHDRFFGYVESMLRPEPYPDHYPGLPKLNALIRVADHLGVKDHYSRVPVHTNFRDLKNGLNHFGIPQSPCVNCGDCEGGCNYTAKNTVDKNYLPDAKTHGAQIFTEITVDYLSRKDGRWVLHCRVTGREQPIVLTAEFVILSAGTLGTTEILLRSAENGCQLSDCVGKRFSGNGDMVGFAYNTDVEINAIGIGDRNPSTMSPVGPCVTDMIDLRGEKPLDQGMVLQGGGMPGAASSLFPEIFKAGARLTAVDSDRGLLDRSRKIGREWQSVLSGPYRGAIRNTHTYLVIAHDDSKGEMVLENNRLRIHWQNVGKGPQFQAASELMRQATAALGGTYIKNPVWNRLTDQDLLTGHPLGGCVMADDAGAGVVNHKGQVFDGDSEKSVHEGLYIMDGSVIPRSLGINPLLTISAIAERSCYHMIQDRGWQNNY